MIILRLALSELSTTTVLFEANDEYAAGFSLVVPHREWEYLGKPREVNFVISAKRLGVGKGEVVREFPR